MNEREQRWRVYRATFDTNIFVRSLVQKENLANHLISLWLEGRFVLVLSQAIVDEIRGVLLRPALMRELQYTRAEAMRLINLLPQASIVEVTSSTELCRDPTDDKFVDCAISGRVQFLVSTDNDLIDDAGLKQALFEFGVTILDPPNFLEKIQEAEINISDFN
ncbi:MAG: putative toxin-antitoxin system toxin component, PIN family [Candidatus Poribacteria bacterium]|nr:putative toxin-antitoxin system toxin component, PIN family [Candidatus Poribacteria bacterium]